MTGPHCFDRDGCVVSGPMMASQVSPSRKPSCIMMQSAARRAALLSKNYPLGSLARRLSLKRTYTTRDWSSQQTPRNVTLLLAGTVLLSATSGYLLATYGSQGSGSTAGATRVRVPGLDNPRYGIAKDFRDAIEELKTTFPEPGAVSDDPEVLKPYGFSENDYHPGDPRFVLEIGMY